MNRRKTHPETDSRRAGIITAALDCFTETGYAGTGMADICRRAGVSTGSMYHHFTGKENLASAVYMEGIRVYQEGLLKRLTAERDARKGITAMVRYHLQWIQDNRSWASFLMEHRYEGFMTETGEAFEALNAHFGGSISGWFTGHIQRGTLQKLSIDVLLSLILGPCQEYTRLYLSGKAVTPPDKAAALISGSLWRSLSAK